jgi:hypothetical protein
MDVTDLDLASLGAQKPRRSDDDGGAGEARAPDEATAGDVDRSVHEGLSS